MQDTQGGHKWSVVKPITSLMKCNLKFSELSDVKDRITLQMPDHFELLYHDNLHYDVIMSAVTDEVCTDHPILTGTESTVYLLISQTSLCS